MDMFIVCVPGHKTTCSVHEATCSQGTAYGNAHKEKQRFIVLVARHKVTSEHATREHATSEQPMDTGPKASSATASQDAASNENYVPGTYTTLTMSM